MGFLQLCALRAGAQVEKNQQCVTKGRLHIWDPWQIQGHAWSQGSGSRVGFGKSLSKEMFYWLMPTEIRLCLQIACRKTEGCSAPTSDGQNP